MLKFRQWLSRSYVSAIASTAIMVVLATGALGAQATKMITTTGVMYVRSVSALMFGDGSVSLPSFTFALDSDTGIFRVGNNQVAAVAGGGESFGWGIGALRMPAASVVAWTNAGVSGSSDLTIGRDGGAGIFFVKNGTSATSIRLYGTTTGPKYLSVGHDGTNGVIDTSATSGLVSIAPTNATSVTIGKAITSLAGVATAGSFGVPPIVAVAETTANSGAVTNTINYTPAAASSTYRLSGVVNVTAWATPASFTVVITYKDASGNARTDTAMVIRSTGASAAAITAVDRWYFSFPSIDIDNSATAITLSTTGTFTGTPAYNFQGTLERIR